MNETGMRRIRQGEDMSSVYFPACRSILSIYFFKHFICVHAAALRSLDVDSDAFSLHR